MIELFDKDFNLLETIFSTIQTPLLMVDPESLIKYINAPANRLLGYQENELLGQTIDTLIPQAFHHQHTQHLKKYFQNPKPRLLHSNQKKPFFAAKKCGKEIPIEISLTPINTLKGLFVICEIIDISYRILNEKKLQAHVQEKTELLQNEIQQHRQTEKALRASEEYFRILTAAAPVGIFHLNLQGEHTFRNKRADKILGFPPGEESLKLDWARNLHPDDRNRVFQEWGEFCGSDEPIFRSEYRFLYPNGDICWVMCEIMPLKDDIGKVVSYIGIASDYTELKKAQTQLQQQRDQFARISRLNFGKEIASSLAHELNQPLSTIIQYSGGCIERLKGEYNPTEIRAILDEIITQAEHAGAVINNLKNFMVKGSCDMSKTDINTLIIDSIQLLDYEITRANIKLCLHLKKSLPQITVNKVQIQQVIINIIKNAIEALSGSDSNERTISLNTKKAAESSIQIQIIDTGPGITEYKMERIFEPFFTSKKEGMGIGLPLVRSILETHHGQVEVLSELDKKTIFTITLPVYQQQKKNEY